MCTECAQTCEAGGGRWVGVQAQWRLGLPRRSWTPALRAAIQGSRVQSSGAVVVLTVPLLTSCASSMRCGRFRQEPSRTALRERRSEPVPRPKRPGPARGSTTAPPLASLTAPLPPACRSPRTPGGLACRSVLTFGRSVTCRPRHRWRLTSTGTLKGTIDGRNPEWADVDSTSDARPAIESSVASLRRVRRAAVASGTRTREPREGETWQRR